MLAHPLAHDVVGDAAGARTAVFLHGILGNKNNLKSFAQKACARVPGLRGVVVDLRGHGLSHGQAPPHTIAACADDVLALPFQPHVVVGHSFGGKVALAMATRAPAGLDAVCALDTPPGLRTFAPDGEIARVLAAVRGFRQPAGSRREVVDALLAAGLSEGIGRWMTTNLIEREVDGRRGLFFMFDLAVIDALLASFAATDTWPIFERALPGGSQTPAIHLVRAGRGGRFTDADVARLAPLAADGRVWVHPIEHVGHWLHTEDPEAVLTVLEPVLRG